jgi:hypothetical protein
MLNIINLKVADCQCYCRIAYLTLLSTCKCEFLLFTVAEWLTHWPATLDVTGSRPNSGDFSEIYFFTNTKTWHHSHQI